MSTMSKASLASFAMCCILGSASGAATGSAGLDRVAPTRVSKLGAADQAGALVRGRQVYDESCMVCHATGVANAPRPSDRPAWDARNKQGFDVLVRHAIDGFRSHPPKGGMPALSGDQVRDAVFYMSSGRAK
ncbi:c-type cytochrome [Massilia sp. CCM 8733]|uniref:C-type cytochrome n=1 Tax=Massilia mucilaginosa TaxID=2609282 RepID=A0ABX0NLV7_9BURK|nr:c-type cytochrome [Massilia mucilaginosa]NHZ87798.1 c-type cytochrome [Massilia mucilaginosa]